MVQGGKIPLGSFITAEAAARAYDGWAAASPGRALGVPTGDELGSARAPRPRAGLTTRPSAHAHGLPRQQHGDNDDEPEQLTDSDGSDGDSDGGKATSIERPRRGTVQGKAPAAGTARGSKADCVRYVGVRIDEGNAFNPFRAAICVNSKIYHICYCPTAEAAARAYDVVACMIPGRALNFPTTTPAAASSSQQRKGASTFPAESDILAAIAALRQAKPPLPRTGAVKYVGVCIDKHSAYNPYRASIKVDGKMKYLGSYPTAEAAASAYDTAARTISGRRLNFPTGGSSSAAACEVVRMDARSLPALGEGRPSQPLCIVHDDVGSPCTAASAHARKRKPPSSSRPRAAAAAQAPARQQHPRQKTHARAADVHHSLQPTQQLPHSAAHVDLPARRSILELFLAGVDEDGEPLNGPTQVGLHDLTVAEHLALVLVKRHGCRCSQLGCSGAS
jgi:hypothetical protein